MKLARYVLRQTAMQGCSITQREKNRASLSLLADQLIEMIHAAEDRIEEGVVMTMGRAPYRRLDCAGRALCYVRVRPAKNFVRIDVSSLWFLPGPVPTNLRATSNRKALVVRCEEELAEAASFVTGIVRAAAARRREAGLRATSDVNLG